MAHWSEESKRLELTTVAVSSVSQLKGIDPNQADVSLFWFPSARSNDDGIRGERAFRALANHCAQLVDSATVCFLTTPADAALLLPHLEQSLKFQLWVAVKTTNDAYPAKMGQLPNRHAALLVLSRYKHSLRHTKTRIQYTYCPACGKTTKDYGGKKHTYHEYGTLMSDVWRDVECDPTNNIEAVTSRLRDFLGLPHYHKEFRVFDMRGCLELQPKPREKRSDKLGTGEGVVPRSRALASRLINDDCFRALGALPDNSIDFCFADPPYNLKKTYDKWDDALESREYFIWCDKWLSELQRVLKPGRTLAVLNIPLWAVRHYQHLKSIMNFQSWIAWDGLGFPVRMVMPAHYALICFSKGDPRPLPGLSSLSDAGDVSVDINPLTESYCLRSSCVRTRRKRGELDRSSLSDLWHDIHRLKHNSRRVDHPCQLPPLLMRRLFALFTRPGEIILDCFNGAGTSTLVADQMNRKYIGFELSSQYHEIAIERHEQIKRGMDPFGKLNTTPTAKNSRVQRMPKQRYAVSKKSLQLDVRRIAQSLGRLPTRDEVLEYSAFPIDYFDNYFVSWGEVCAAARTTGMSENPLATSSEVRDDQLALYSLSAE